MDKPRHTMMIKPLKAAITLLMLSMVLVGLSLLGQYFRFFPDNYHLSGPAQEFFLDMFIDQFSVNTESNIPTYFNTLILAIAALLVFVIASGKQASGDKFRNEWSLLAFVFLYLSIDEAAVIHERFNALFKDAPDISGWLHYKWLIPGAIIVTILGLAFLRFFLHLDNRYKTLFFISAILYLFGAFGGELISGRYANSFGTKSFTYSALTTVEELLEWLGVTSMIYTLLTYIRTHFSDIQFRSETKTQQKNDL